PRLEPETGTDRLLDAFLVDHREHAGHGRIDERHVRIGLAAERGGGAGEELRARGHLGMDLHADDDLPDARYAFDELRFHQRSIHHSVAGGAASAAPRAYVMSGIPLGL